MEIEIIIIYNAIHKVSTRSIIS